MTRPSNPCAPEPRAPAAAAFAHNPPCTRVLPQLTEAAVKAALQEDAEGLLAEVALDSSKSKVRGTPRRRRVAPSPSEPGVSGSPRSRR